MNLITELIIRVIIIVSIVDVAVFYAIKRYPEKVTIPFLILTIIATITPNINKFLALALLIKTLYNQHYSLT